MSRLVDEFIERHKNRINWQPFVMTKEQMQNRLTAFRLPDYLLSRVDDFCKGREMTRSKFLRWAIIDFFDHHVTISTTVSSIPNALEVDTP
jgi:hypothetical protein